jgi:hypothetical protein
VSHICGDMDEVELLSSDSYNMLMSWRIGMHVSIYNIPYFIHPPGNSSNREIYMPFHTMQFKQ